MTFQPKYSLTFSALFSAIVLTACQPQQQNVEAQSTQAQAEPQTQPQVKSGLAEPLGNAAAVARNL